MTEVNSHPDNKYGNKDNKKEGTILITGATGNVGAEVVKALGKTGQPVRAAVRDLRNSQWLGGENIDLVQFDFKNLSSYEAAFRGVNRLFLMRPPAISNVQRDIGPVISAAKKAGVEHVVFLSLVGVEKNKLVPHHKIEELLIASGMKWTFLRCGFFMQNLDTTQRQDIQKYNDIFVPAGRGKTSFIDVRDIGAVAAKVLTEVGHTNKAYTLTGGEALDYYQVAAIFTHELGRPVSYSNPSPLKFFLRWSSRKKPVSFTFVMTILYITVALGWDGTISPDLDQLLSRPPITLRQYVRDYKKCWL